jgi:hypothetical protein
MAMLPQFLSYQMMSPYFELQFNQAGTGSTVKHLPLPSCQSFEVRVPSIVLCSPTLDRRKLGFLGYFHDDGLVTPSG